MGYAIDSLAAKNMLCIDCACDVMSCMLLMVTVQLAIALED